MNMSDLSHEQAGPGCETLLTVAPGRTTMTMRDTPHILIIEDEPVTRATLAAYLDQSGYRISVADDAAAAEATLAADPADLLLIDVNLSGKDGLQITREQRAISEVGIILISALTEDVDRIV